MGAYFSRASTRVRPAAYGRSAGPDPIPLTPSVRAMERNTSSEAELVEEKEEAKGPSECHGAGERVIVAMTMRLSDQPHSMDAV